VTSCESHCRRCGRHFLTDEAFDAHRQFAEDHYGDWEHRVCLGIGDAEMFEVVDGDGVCDISGPTPLLHVQIIRLKPGWTVGSGQEALAEVGPTP